MNIRSTFFCLLLFGLPVVGRGDDGIAKLIEQFERLPDEATKSRQVMIINKAMRDQIQATQVSANRPTNDSDRALVVATYRRELDSAESLELVSLLAHSWWLFEDRKKDLSPETVKLVISMLDDVRTTGRKVTPATPRERAIAILSSCTDSIQNDVVALMGHENPMRRAAAIRILATRGYFEDHFDRLVSFADSDDRNIRLSVAHAFEFSKSHHDEIVVVGQRMLGRGEADSEIALALSAHAEEIGPQRAAELQNTLIDGLESVSFNTTYRRAIRATVPYLSSKNKRDAVRKLIPQLNPSDPWIERAVAAAGPDAAEALPYFLKTYESVDDSKKLRRAAELWKIERNSDRVISLLIQAIDKPKSTERWYAFRGLQTLGSEADSAVPKLTRMLENENHTIVRQCLDTIAAIGTDNEETLNAVAAIAKNHDNDRVRATAEQTLSALQE